MPTEGPCRVEGCTDPSNWSGQWQYIPEKYCLEHDNLEFRTSCTCKKPASQFPVSIFLRSPDYGIMDMV